LLLLVLFTSSGCVERSVTIRSEPAGATVTLDGQYVGRTPVTIPFTYYGNHSICLSLEGYLTISGTLEINSPWYQKPGVDFVSENLYPWTVFDSHTKTFTLVEATRVDPAEAEKKAAEMKILQEEFLRKRNSK
jgi:hypothetical protein